MNVNRIYLYRPLAAALALLNGAACVSMPPDETADAAPEAIAEVAAPAAAPPAAPPTVARPRQQAEERFEVDSEDSSAASFFRALSEYTPRNVVVHPGVSGSITLKLTDVTVVDVLEIASEIYGYGYTEGPAGYIVYPASTRTRIFEIDYLDLQRSGTSRTRVSSGQVSEGNRARGQNRMASAIAGTPVGGQSGGQEISGSNINTSYETDFWAELETTLRDMVGDEPDSQVVVNSQTGVVVVRAMPQSLRSIEQYLDTIQDVAQRQVILEAKIVEVTLSDAYESGINWIAVAQNSDGQSFTFGQTAPPRGFSGDLDMLGGQPIVVSPGTVYNGIETASTGGAFTMAFDIGDFNAFLELLEVHGDTRILSSPRVSTLNNQKAVIKAGTDEFFVTNVSSNTVTGASSTTSRDVELTPFFSGIALDVTPQISEEGEVTLHIHPTVSEVSDQQKNLTVSGETDVLPLAFSEIRESDSVVRARSGQIIVIGGLMRNSEFDQRFGIPGLSRVPGVGKLFSSQRKISRKTELVILLKPVVVTGDSSWSEAMTGSIAATLPGSR